MGYRKICLFLGAGISYNSGVPTVKTLLPYLLSPLHLNKKDYIQIINKKFQFEKLIEVLSKHFDVSKLTKVFHSNYTNSNHELIADLCAHDLIDSIVTTNFDTLIEQELKKRQVPFNVVSTPFGAKKLSNKAVNIVKLHGDLLDEKNLGIQLQVITNQVAIKGLEKIFLRVLNRTTIETFVFAGYSFSDFYDVLPVLKKYSPKNKNYIIFNHTPSILLNDLLIEEHCIDLLNSNLASVINYNTDEVVKSLQHILFDKVNIPFICYNDLMKDKIDEWVNQINNSSAFEKYFACAEIMRMLSHNKNALKYYKKALRLAPSLNQNLHIESKIASIYLKIGDVDLAISIYEKLREKYEESHDRKGIALCSGDLASAYRQTGRYDEAITLFKGALRYAHQTKDRYEIQNNFISIGNCYIGTGDYQKALTYFNKALPITVERGDITNNIINSFSIFAAYIKLKRYDDAKQVLEVMKDSVFSFGNDRFKSIYLSNEGIIFEKKLEFSMAILKYNSAYKAAKEITDPYVLFLILKNRAFCNYKLKKYKETIADINKSLTLVGERYKSQKRIIAEMRALLKKAEAKNT